MLTGMLIVGLPNLFFIPSQQIRFYIKNDKEYYGK